MAVESGVVAAINLDRTLADHVMGRFFGDAYRAGVNVPYMFERTRVQDKRERLLQWLKGKEVSVIEPVVEITEEQAPGRIAKWGRAVIDRETDLGNSLCIMSSSVPDFILNAYVRGIHNVVPGVRIPFAYGRPFLIKNEHEFTGEKGPMLKRATVESIISSGYRLGLAADSFAVGMGVVRRGEPSLVVNPEPRLADTDGSLVLHWEEGSSEVAVAYPEDRADDALCTYDLDNSRELAEFLEDIYEKPE